MNAWTILLMAVVMAVLIQAHPLDEEHAVEGTMDAGQQDSRDGMVDNEVSMYTQHFSGIVDAGYLWKDNMEVREGQIDRGQPHGGILDTGLNAPWAGFAE